MFLSSHLNAIYLPPWKCILKIHLVSTKKAFSLLSPNLQFFPKCLLIFPFRNDKDSLHSWPLFATLFSYSFVTPFTESFIDHLVDMTTTITLGFTMFLYFTLIYIHNKPYEVSLEGSQKGKLPVYSDMTQNSSLWPPRHMWPPGPHLLAPSQTTYPTTHWAPVT